jgi:hypothetical protein
MFSQRVMLKLVSLVLNSDLFQDRIWMHGVTSIVWIRQDLMHAGHIRITFTYLVGQSVWG